MPNMKNAEKRIRVVAKQKVVNNEYKSSMRTAIKNVEKAVISKDKSKATENLKNAIPLINREMVEKWVEDLIIYKTFNGLYMQKAILASLAERKNQKYRLSTPNEESVGIDGFVGNTPYSIKPYTYKTMNRLSEVIDVKMIFYIKTKTGLKIEVEE